MRLLYLRFINLSGSLPILGLFGKTSIKTGENIHWKSSLKGKEPFADQKNSLNADLEREGSSRNERCFHFLCLRISRTSYISAQSIGQLLYVIVYGYVRFREVQEESPKSFSRMSTNQLVVFSMMFTTPVMTTFSMISQAYKAVAMTKFLRNSAKIMKREACTVPRHATAVLSLGLLLYTILPFQVLGPGISSRSVYMSSVQLAWVSVADAVFWLIAVPGILSPCFLYTFSALCLCQLFNKITGRANSFVNEGKLKEREGLKMTSFQFCNSSIKSEWIVRRSQELDSLEKSYIVAAKLIVRCNEAFSPSLLFTNLFASLELCMFVYDTTISVFFHSEGAGYQTHYMKFFYCILFASLIVMANEAGHQLTKKSSDCLGMIHDVVLKHELSKGFLSWQEYSRVSSLLGVDKAPSCHASHFFVFSRQTIVGVASAILTYIIILVQFKNSEPEKTV